MAQEICGVVIASVRNENGSGGSSPACCSEGIPIDGGGRSRGGVPVLSRPSRSPSGRGAPTAQRRGLARTAGRDLLLAEVDHAVEEGARGQHDGAGREPAAVASDDPGNPAIAHHQVLDAALDHLEPGGLADRGLHGGAVERPVGLGARALHGGALGAVEEAELDPGRVGDAAHQAVERIDLAHQMALAEAADGGIAGHLADGGEAVGDEDRASAHARGRGGGLAPGVAAADDDHIEGLVAVIWAAAISTCALGPRGQSQSPWLRQVSRESTGHVSSSLADAEAGEDLTQHVLDVDPAGDAAQRMDGRAQLLGAQLDVVRGMPAREALRALRGRSR